MFRTSFAALAALLVGATTFAGAPMLWLLPRPDAKPEIVYELRLVQVSDDFFESHHWQTQKSPGLKGFFATFPPATVLDAEGRDISATYRKAGGPRTAQLTDMELFLLMEKCQADRNFSVTQAPKLTTANGQAANISLADQTEFITGVSVQVVDGEPKVVPEKVTVMAGTGSPSIFVDIGGKLTPDGKSVRVHMDEKYIYFADRIPEHPVTLTMPTRGTDGKVKSKTVTYKVQKPEPTTQRIDMHLQIPVGGTVLIDGGELAYASYRSRLFGAEQKEWHRSHFLVLLTARIAPEED